jgi:hypothetical protein
MRSPSHYLVTGKIFKEIERCDDLTYRGVGKDALISMQTTDNNFGKRSFFKAFNYGKIHTLIE